MWRFRELLHAVRDLLAEYLAEVAARQAQALLTIVYWTAVALAAVAVRVTRTRLLSSSFGKPGSHWLPRGTETPTVRSSSRQF